MKTTVTVYLKAEQAVDIEIEHGDDEDPTDLTAEDEDRAIAKAKWPEWEISRAREVEP